MRTRQNEEEKDLQESNALIGRSTMGTVALTGSTLLACQYGWKLFNELNQHMHRNSAKFVNGVTWVALFLISIPALVFLGGILGKKGFIPKLYADSWFIRWLRYTANEECPAAIANTNYPFEPIKMSAQQKWCAAILAIFTILADIFATLEYTDNYKHYLHEQGFTRDARRFTTGLTFVLGYILTISQALNLGSALGGLIEKCANSNCLTSSAESRTAITHSYNKKTTSKKSSQNDAVIEMPVMNNGDNNKTKRTSSNLSLE